jgi:hypothetical protein
MGYIDRAIYIVAGVEVEIRTLTGGGEYRVFRDGISYDVWQEETGWFVEINGREVGPWATAEALIEEKFLTPPEGWAPADTAEPEPTRSYSDRVVHIVNGMDVEVRKILDQDAYDVFIEGDRFEVWLDSEKGGWFFQIGNDGDADGPWPTDEALLAQAFLNPDGY